MPLIAAVVFVYSVFYTFSTLDHIGAKDGKLLLPSQLYMYGQHANCMGACMGYIFCGLAMSAKPTLLYNWRELKDR